MMDKEFFRYAKIFIYRLSLTNADHSSFLFGVLDDCLYAGELVVGKLHHRVAWQNAFAH